MANYINKVCPKCNGFMNLNSYFNLMICDKCHYQEQYKNEDYIEPIQLPITYAVMIHKINEIIAALNRITNPRYKEEEENEYKSED